MSNLKNVRDFDDETLSLEVRKQVYDFLRRGYDRAHLCFNDEGRVFFDKELAENATFDELIYLNGDAAGDRNTA